MFLLASFALPFTHHKAPKFPLVVLLEKSSYFCRHMCSRSSKTVSNLISRNYNVAGDPAKKLFDLIPELQ